MSSYEDKAGSYNDQTYSAALQSPVAATRAGDGDARHIAMKSISMKAEKSISQINSYAESDKGTLYIKNGSFFLPAGISTGTLEHPIQRKTAIRFSWIYAERKGNKGLMGSTNRKKIGEL